MNIGIDIDGVLTDLERMAIDYGTKLCVEEDWPIELNVSEYLETKTFNWTEEQALKLWNKCLFQYVTQGASRTFAPEVIERLREEGHKIYIITARDEYGLPEEHYGKMQELTKKWLKDQNIEYEKIIFAKNKLPHCIENNIDVMIEDSPDNIIGISEKIKVIKFDCQYNKHVEKDNVYTAYSWYHIYRIIKEMNK